MVGDSLGRPEEPGYCPFCGLDFLRGGGIPLESTEPKSVRTIPLIWKGCGDQLEGRYTGPERAVGCRQGLFLQNRQGTVTS